MIMEKCKSVVLVLAILVLCGTTSTTEGSEPTTGLISHWKFDDSEGTTAVDSVGQNDGVLLGGPIWTTGQIGGALDFDGVNDCVYIPEDTSLNLTNTSFSFSAWVYPHYQSRAGVVFHQHAYSLTRGVVLVSIYPAGTLRFGFYNDDLNTESDTITFDAWNHIVCTYDYGSDVSTVYINGVLEVTGDAGPYEGGLVDSYIGKSWDGFHGKGIIDEVAVWDRALSSEEIRWLYHDGLTGHGNLTDIGIGGPAEVAENFRGQYQAIAYYDNGRSVDVTDLAAWTVEPDTIGSIDNNGLLQTGEVDLPQEIIITAQYGESDIDVEAEKDVVVLDICPSGSALQFNDIVNDYVEIEGYQGVGGSNPRTITAWVRAESNGSNLAIVRWGTTETTGALWYNGITPDGKLRAAVIGGSVVGGTVINDDTWHHVAIVLPDKENVKVEDILLYVDGEQEYTTISLGSQTINTAVGMDVLIASNYSDGLLDEVRIWNVALTQEQIQAGMHRRLEGAQVGLMGYWGFDEGQGQVAYDLSGNGNDGYLGSDPDNPDDSDPTWVESDAPIGICSLLDIAVENIEEIIAGKEQLLGVIDQLLDQEKYVERVLDEMLKSSRYDKHDITLAKHSLSSAQMYERHAAKTLNKSIDELEDSLSALAGDSQPPGKGKNGKDDQDEIEWADINADGTIDTMDFNILAQHWLDSYDMDE